MRDARLTGHAKAMRREAGEPETRLWLALRAERLNGIKFRRQKVIGRYIADFAARDPMLVVEVDGDTHGGREDYDAKRTRFFEEQGYRVIRFSNLDVMTNLVGVLGAIAEAAAAPLSQPSPLKGRGL
ncbi:endonuclease domain-containing protein [uncultured Sphingomonas sp.]|uniref:endonuclease domain-containing protein n=1 Tax=uncultured Sphingomonas sp. TaxID=158754 RepID=UPI00345C2729